MSTAPPQARMAGKILNRVGAEVGLEPVTDPYSSQDPAWIQMRTLLNVACDELAVMFQWEALQREHAISTLDTDSGDYPLPVDFDHMINQTGWERSQNVPLFGPLSPQDWQYLLGRDLVDQTIYASFRIQEGIFSIFPQPPPNGLDIHFEYVSMYWCQDATSTPANPLFKEEAEAFGDLPMFHHLLVNRYVRLKYYTAKGLPTEGAQADFDAIYGLLTGQTMGAEILNAGRGNRVFPYLDGIYSVPDTGFGNA